MRYLPRIAALSLMLGFQFACSDSSPVTQPTQESLDASSGSGRLIQDIQVRDACDGPSFNAVLGAGACIRKNGLLFDRFIALVTRDKSAGAWKFNPEQQDVKRGTTLVATNRGGETHSFTKVRRFGGGIIPLLNQLTGNLTVAPECAALPPQGFLLAGATQRTRVGAVGIERYQCCIHPWMRAVITVRNN